MISDTLNFVERIKKSNLSKEFVSSSDEDSSAGENLRDPSDIIISSGRFPNHVYV